MTEVGIGNILDKDPANVHPTLPFVGLGPDRTGCRVIYRTHHPCHPTELTTTISTEGQTKDCGRGAEPRVDAEEEVDWSCSVRFAVGFVESSISNFGTRPNIKLQTFMYIVFLLNQYRSIGREVNTLYDLITK